MTKQEIAQRRCRAQPIVLRAWRKHNPGVRIIPMTDHNPHYYITDDGRAYCFRTEDWLHRRGKYILAPLRMQKPNRSGSFKGGTHNYWEVALNVTNPNHRYYGKPARHFALHRLVAYYFCEGRTEEKCQVDHIDGNPENNCAANLEWVTPEENARRAVAMRRQGSRRGSVSKDSFLSRDGEEEMVDKLPHATEPSPRLPFPFHDPLVMELCRSLSGTIHHT